MEKIKIWFLTILSLLLPSCSNNLSNKDNVNNDTTENYTSSKLNTELIKEPIDEPDNNIIPKENNIISNNKIIVSGERIANTPPKIENMPKKEVPKKDPNILSSFSTKVYTKTADRQKNLRIVCEKLSGTILKPGEDFSYNNTCGPYNKANGFGKATIFLKDGTEKQDYGGGVCQLSSTLYNAIKNLNVKILERHKHSKKVYYVPDGQDATVSYGNLDFRFKNNNDFSIKLEASSNKNNVKVTVYKV